jgi:dolichyl-phosphate-mannose--protein O-mannosyl transferase
VVPWAYYAIADHRTMFLFYALPALPFMIIALTLSAGLILGPAISGSPRRVFGAAVVGAFALLVLIDFWWLYPILSATSVPYQEWLRRMLFRSWI